MSLPPVDAVDASIPEWMGHIGLMDMDGIKAKTGGWVASAWIFNGLILTHLLTFVLSHL